MMMQESETQRNMERILLQFRQLHHALIDASSIIYMEKAGYLKTVSDILTLYSPEKVIQETGYRGLNIQPLAVGKRAMPPDEILLHCARQRMWPVITEDMGIIRQLERDELSYFNALMMLEFVLYRNLIGLEEYARHRQKLLLHAWYSSEIVKLGETVHQMLKGKC